MRDLVGATGFEPATFSSRTRRATKLRYAPFDGAHSTEKLLMHKGLGEIFFAGRVCRRFAAGCPVRPIGSFQQIRTIDVGQAGIVLGTVERHGAHGGEDMPWAALAFPPGTLQVG